MKNKRPKRELAKKMMTREETKKGVGPFDCDAWGQRKESKMKKVILERKKAIARVTT